MVVGSSAVVSLEVVPVRIEVAHWDVLVEHHSARSRSVISNDFWKQGNILEQEGDQKEGNGDYPQGLTLSWYTQIYIRNFSSLKG